MGIFLKVLAVLVWLFALFAILVGVVGVEIGKTVSGVACFANAIAMALSL